MSISSDAIANGITTLIGAFLGAGLAFLIQEISQRRQSRTADLMSAHKMLFSLLQQTNTLLLLYQDFFAPYLTHGGRFIAIPAIQEVRVDRDVVDASTYAFMLVSKESRLILYDFYMAQACYVEAMMIINERSRLHRSEVQPKLAASTIINGSLTTDAEVIKALGRYTYETMTSLTDESIRSMELAYLKLVACKANLRPHFVKHFETMDFSEFEVPNNLAGGNSMVAPKPAKSEQPE